MLTLVNSYFLLSLRVKLNSHGREVNIRDKVGAEITEIEPQPFINGSLNFDRKLTLNVNMYYDTVKEVFLEKKVLRSLYSHYLP